MASKRKVSPQLKLQRQLTQTEAGIDMRTLFIYFKAPHERELLRTRIWHSGLGNEYMASFMRHAALAAAVVMEVRGVNSVTIRQRKSRDNDGPQYELLTRRKTRRRKLPQFDLSKRHE